MFTEDDYSIRLNITHSHTKTVLAEQRFHGSTKIYEVKNHLCKKYGTLPEYMKLRLKGKEIFLDDEDQTLAYYKVNDLDTVHVIDSNPNSVMVQNNFDDLSTVKKYEMSNEDYDKRNDTVRKFRKQLEKDPEYIKMIKENKGPTFEEEASSLEIGKRCLLGDGQRRGEIMYVGLCAQMGYGFWVGVKLDEPLGDSNGVIKGKKYFECEANFGLFVRPDYVKMGDYPPVDIFNELEDEI